jgi:hypothetical protein
MRPGIKWGIVTVVGVVAVVLVAWVLWPQPSTGQTQTAEANGVTVIATLRDGGLVFDVILDTHTVDLTSYDLVANSKLIVDGQTLQPQGESRTTNNTGHHVEGTLRFDGERHGTIVLILEDLGGVPERRLEFKA